MKYTITIAIAVIIAAAAINICKTDIEATGQQVVDNRYQVIDSIN